MKRKSRLVKWGIKTRKESFLLASKSGFEKSLRETAEKEKVVLINLNNFGAINAQVIKKFK